jgi:[FeFe] hydrogenase H-cluster maturation GTPase HydF
MKDTPRGLRLTIGVFGRRNAGKSSLVNALCGQAVSVVSEIPGTTTDPVEKAMELPPLGPVLFVDTAGLDDDGDLGALRVDRARRALARVDLAVVVARADAWDEPEEELAGALSARGVPFVVALNHRDRVTPEASLVRSRALEARGFLVVATDALHRGGLADLRGALALRAPKGQVGSLPLLSDLVPPGELVVLVTPIDPEAPKGRLILPQVQAIRDLLDGDQMALVVKERELRAALDRLRRPPALVVTDSQAFLKVAADVPIEIPLTSFSILMARAKGDLATFVRGARAIESLRPGARVLLAEACTHHPTAEDIGRVKIPRWLEQYVGGKLSFTAASGHDFPDDLASHDLVVHCGGCTLGRREMVSRLEACRAAGVPVTNYGIAIATSLGILDRALSPFPALLSAR